jgi:hypothetical protein
VKRYRVENSTRVMASSPTERRMDTQLVEKGDEKFSLKDKQNLSGFSLCVLPREVQSESQTILRISSV